jgi:pimeloyl-ACP methyl ester carboxylesterase
VSGRSVVRAAFAIVSSLAPAIASQLAIRLFLRPPRHRRSARIRELLSTGVQQTLQVHGRRIATWQWGDGPRIALVHGWAGVGGQLATFVPLLLGEGFSVVTFDGPGHGASDGRESSLLDFSDTIAAVAARTGPLHGLIAHSLGAAAATCAISRGLPVDRVAFIAPPSRPSHWVGVFGREIGASDAVIRRMHADVVRYVDSDWDAIETIRLAPRQHVPLLIVHDEEDQDVPLRQGEELAQAWPDADLITTRGLGHRRILRDPTILSVITEFITAPGRAPREFDRSEGLASAAARPRSCATSAKADSAAEAQAFHGARLGGGAGKHFGPSCLSL